jgi:hypothetical protein
LDYDANVRKKSQKNEVSQKQLDICLNLLTGLNELLLHLPNSDEEVEDFYFYLENKPQTKITQSEMMLFLSQDVSTNFFVAYTFPQEALYKKLPYKDISTKACIYRNVFLRVVKDELNIKIENQITKQQNKRFDKYFDEEAKRLYSE